jgi:hypothetical protein
MKTKTDYPNYMRDMNSNAILAHDRKSLFQHRKKINDGVEINNIKQDLKDLKHQMNLVLQILNK